MKKGIVSLLVCIIIPTTSFSFDEKRFEEIVKKIPNANSKLIHFYRSISKEVDEISAGHDEKREVDLSKKLYVLLVCVQSPGSKLQEPKYYELQKEVMGEIELIASKLNKIEKSEKYKNELQKYMDELTDKKNEHQCEDMFKVPEKSQALEAKEVHEKYIEIMNLKKISHPEFVRFLELFNGRDPKLTQDQYEKSFLEAINVYAQTYYEAAASKVILDYKKNCPIPAEEIYKKLCQTDIKYNSVPFENLRLGYCVRDNLKNEMVKNNPKCNQIGKF